MNDEDILNMWNEFVELLKSTHRQNIDKIIDWLSSTDFRYAPASTQYHNSFRGGLLSHSLNVYHILKNDFKMMVDFMEIPDDTIILTSLLHDVCKIDCYTESTKNIKDETGNWITVPFYQFDEKRPWGHGEKSVILLLQHGLYLNDVEISMIRNHMGFTSSDDDRRVSKLFRLCPQSYLLYNADMEATNLIESYDGPKRFRDKITARCITDCNNQSTDEINIDNSVYKLAPVDVEVDGTKIIEIPINKGTKVKVYSPYGDGLPF